LTARWLLAAATPEIGRRGLTLLGVAVGNLETAPPLQLAVSYRPKSDADLDAALDAVRERFGHKAITRAVLIGRTARPEMPLLPD
jgi:DNA polymerase-4